MLDEKIITCDIITLLTNLAHELQDNFIRQEHV